MSFVLIRLTENIPSSTFPLLVTELAILLSGPHIQMVVGHSTSFTHSEVMIKRTVADPRTYDSWGHCRPVLRLCRIQNAAGGDVTPDPEATDRLLHPKKGG